MTTAIARRDANQRDDLKATGPATAEGKAASRLNAFRHAPAGGGNGLGPGEEAQLVAKRALGFARELRATGLLGHLLAHRAALLSVRLERMAAGEMIAVAAADQQARATFDADRAAAIDALLDEAATPEVDPAPALGALAESPDGLDRLLAAWSDLRTGLRSPEPAPAARQAERWLGGKADPTAPALALDPTLSELTRRVEAEINRLQARRGAMGDATRAIEHARADAGTLAQFDPSPEAALARRYEAATERGLFRAIRAIAEINREAGRPPEAAGLTADLEATLARLHEAMAESAPTAPPREQRPAPSLGSFRAPAINPLASFRAGLDPTADPGRLASPTASSAPVEDRPRRPDLRKLNQKLARNRR